MRRVINRPAIKQDQVLVRSASPHIESAGYLAHRLDSRQGHDHFQDIQLTESRRDILDLFHFQTSHAQSRTPHVLHDIRRNGNLAQGIYLFFQLDI